MARQYVHLFSLPQDLLDTLSHRNVLKQEEPEKRVKDSVKLEAEPSTQSGIGSLSCNICLGATFDDVDDQRSHFRSDWHRYNVKSRLSNGKVVSEADFGVLVESLEDSLSGSESSSENEDTSDTDAVQNLLAKSRVKSRSPSPTGIPNIPVTAITWFHSPPSTQIGVYRAVFPTGAQVGSYLSELHDMQTPVPEGRKWAMFMVAGGHFAGLVARVSRPEGVDNIVQNGKQKKVIADIEILRHKTFHRYTTRRKQGGSQSLNDNAKGNAKSAGALLRRYGEQALRDDIRNLIEEWKEDISSSERIFIRASGANRRIFMDYDGAIIFKGDERLRTFPFPTRRPTQAELSRCLIELTRVKITHFTEEELRAQDEAYLASLPKPKPQPNPVSGSKLPEKKNLAPKLSKEEELQRDKWNRLCDMVKKGRLDAAKTFWDRESKTLGGIDTRIPDFLGEKVGTLLQLAVINGQAEMTEWLLDNMNADPTIPVPVVVYRAPQPEDKEILDKRSLTSEDARSQSNRVAYDIASTREVRDVFRKSAGKRPDAWDWLGSGHIPSVLSAEMEANRDSRKKERRKGLKEKIKEREAKERERVKESEEEVAEVQPRPAPTPVKAGPQKLGGTSTAGQSLAGLTPEMRARIERERRARAAEARFKSSG